jgi:hypothetical protein
MFAAVCGAHFRYADGRHRTRRRRGGSLNTATGARQRPKQDGRGEIHERAGLLEPWRA